MKSRFLGRAVALAFVSCLGLPIACGGSESSDGSSAGGGANAGGGAAGSSSGGASGARASAGAAGLMLPPGTSTMPKTIQCGGECTSARAGFVYVDPCCTAGDNAVCGVDTSYLTMTGAMLKSGCEPKHQPGELNAACPSPAPSMIMVMGAMAALDPFPGCCRPNGTCGVSIDTVTAANGLVPIADLALGCVDAAQFFPGQAAVACSDTGAAGAAGAGPGVNESFAGAGGAP